MYGYVTQSDLLSLFDADMFKITCRKTTDAYHRATAYKR